MAFGQEAQGNAQEETLEEALEELDGIVEQIGRHDISLEDSFALYQRGMEKLKFCNGKIDAVEKQLVLLEEEEADEEEASEEEENETEVDEGVF